MWLFLLTLVLETLNHGVFAVVPTGQMSIRYTDERINFAVGSFGLDLDEYGDMVNHRLLRPSGSSNRQGCSSISVPSYYPSNTPYILLLERGSCSYYDKAINAKAAGASGMLVHNTLEGIYANKQYASSEAYECKNGKGWVSQSHMSGNIWSSTNQALVPSSCSGNKKCSSKQCVYTNSTNSEGEQEVCCAWDLYMSMAAETSIELPLGFLRMEDADTLQSYSYLDKNMMDVLLYDRSVFWAWSSFFIWLMAIGTVAYGSILAAEEDKLMIHTGGKSRQELEKDASDTTKAMESGEEESVGSLPTLRRNRNKRLFDHQTNNAIIPSLGADESNRHVNNTNDEYGGIQGDDSGKCNSYQHSHRVTFDESVYDSDGNSIGASDSGMSHHSYGSFASFRSGVSEIYYRVKGKVIHAVEQLANEENTDTNTLELNGYHALAFVVMASSFLLLLYYVDLFKFVTIAYLCASTYAIYSVCTKPILEYIQRTINIMDFMSDVYDQQSDIVSYIYNTIVSISSYGTTDDRRNSMDSSQFSYHYQDEESRSGSRDERDEERDGLLRNQEPVGERYSGKPVYPEDPASIEGGGTYTADDDLGLLDMERRKADDNDDSLSDINVNEKGRGVMARLVGESPNLAYVMTVLDPCNIIAVFCACALPLLWFFWPAMPGLWVLQDIMGICVCTLFLCTMRIPNLQVATILLCCAFLYDVFFVFISPLLFNSNVMLSVANGSSGMDSSSPLISDENYCEKYPSDSLCTTTDVPMLLYVPAIWTWNTDSNALLGLGDIILPGLLLVWCARYDMRRFGSLSTEKAGNGYFPMTLCGYAFGLCLANTAVNAFNYGQPALFYIVPCTLGLVLYRAGRAGNLMYLWGKLPTTRTIAQMLDAEEADLLAQDDTVVNTDAVIRVRSDAEEAVIPIRGAPIFLVES
jgi:hypothetical protein